MGLHHNLAALCAKAVRADRPLSFAMGLRSI
jgi:hypothetical protein